VNLEVVDSKEVVLEVVNIEVFDSKVVDSKEADSKVVDSIVVDSEEELREYGINPVVVEESKYGIRPVVGGDVVDVRRYGIKPEEGECVLGGVVSLRLQYLQKAAGEGAGL